jgi:hypothetical protein
MSRKEPHEQLSELGNTHSATVFAWDEQLPREAFFVYFSKNTNQYLWLRYKESILL